MPKAQRQESSVVSQPPSSGPRAAAPPIVEPQMAKATARSLPRKFALMIDNDVGSINAPPRPCSSRAPINSVPLLDTAASTLASTNTTMPRLNSSRRPHRSASRPNINRKAANTSV